ncbi:30S ribosomal protein S20 [Candidatus Epulonipiscium fishelsonii]|uniref:30S ribosomal protein S20 n=1 Tax=Candidatus Epulonipiscium fishelsonii TaxID=77094 RepID=A0ACC8XGH8_9FIRM|nr:30S ribosomal protein S20 [Epulopiscium sp. SCG-B05WGA-EpuloA1]ONI42586.1 30S ribosomal protein S20 [Epulopiscium sp. SCG-B11WGA-EpuloA1]ONI47097.1 30S ribosomal protein S20 [Epulopiscium sp. SCG-C06WGA-EpuloA1]
MANIKSAKKRIKVIATKTARNRAITSAVKTYSKKVISAVQAKDKELAQTQLKIAVKKIDQATSKGIFHSNTAGRKKSKLQRLVNQIA